MTATRSKRTIPASEAIPAEVAACRDAAARLIEENDGKFRQWERRIQFNHEMRGDAFIALMYSRYKVDHEALLRDLGTRFIDALMPVIRYYRLRFVSISAGDLIGFEQVTWPQRVGGVRYTWDRPVEWQIADELGIGWGCGNSGHHQVRLLSLPTSLQGVYDIRAEKPVRLAPPLALRTCCMSKVREPFDTTDIRGHLEACGANIG